MTPHILAAFKTWIEGGLKPNAATGKARETRAVVQVTVDAASLGAPKAPPDFIRSLPPLVNAPKLVRALPVMARLFVELEVEIREWRFRRDRFSYP